MLVPLRRLLLLVVMVPVLVVVLLLLVVCAPNPSCPVRPKHGRVFHEQPGQSVHGPQVTHAAVQVTKQQPMLQNQVELIQLLRHVSHAALSGGCGALRCIRRTPHGCRLLLHWLLLLLLLHWLLLRWLLLKGGRWLQLLHRLLHPAAVSEVACQQWRGQRAGGRGTGVGQHAVRLHHRQPHSRQQVLWVDEGGRG